MWLIIGLMIGIVITTGVIFIVLKNVVVKLVAMALLVASLVLVVALGGEIFGQYTKPLIIKGNTVQVYHEGQPVQFKVKDVHRLSIVKVEGGKIEVSFFVKGYAYSFRTNKLVYEWSMKNDLRKKFSKVMHDATY